jgi:uncharacterized protein YmfQ (DUF2313 family)
MNILIPTKKNPGLSKEELIELAYDLGFNVRIINQYHMEIYNEETCLNFLHQRGIVLYV